MSTESTRSYLTPQGTNIHYISSGKDQGPLAVLLHGLGGSNKTFQNLIPSIPSYHIINIDIEGFGETPLNPREPLSFERYVLDIHDLITHVQEHSPRLETATNLPTTNGLDTNSKTKPILLIGHSLGGIISLHYAAQYPAEVTGLLLLGIGRSLREIPPAQDRMRNLAVTAREEGMAAVSEIAVKTNFPASRENDNAHVEEVREAVRSCSAEAYAATAEVVASDDHHDPDYGIIRCPAVFVAGDEDSISPPQRSMDLAGLMGSRSEVPVVVLKSGHQMILEDLEGVKGALAKLIEML